MKDSRFTSTLLVLLVSGGVLPAVVLPRPPSSPNYIPQEYAGVGQEAKAYNAEKAMYQSTNVEKPDTQDYRYDFRFASKAQCAIERVAVTPGDN